MGMVKEVYGKKLGASRLLALSALAALAIAGISQTTRAALVATDNAGNAPYAVNTSFGGENGGSGFGAWSVVNNSGSNFISGDNWSSTTPWFDIYNPGGNQTTATRSLDSVLSSGETLSFDLVLNNAQTGASVGFFLADSGGTGLLTYYQDGNSATEGFIADASGTTSGIGVPYNYQSVDLMAITLTSTTTYNFYVNNTLAHSGTISDATGGIARLNFFDNNGGSNSDVQFTNLSIVSAAVPIPASFGLVLAGGIGLAVMAIRRRSAAAKA